jgi:hypothetical protein
MDIYTKNFAEITDDPLYPVVAMQAYAKGFRLATASEVRASANFDNGAAELYSAYGVNWVKNEH